MVSLAENTNWKSQMPGSQCSSVHMPGAQTVGLETEELWAIEIPELLTHVVWSAAIISSKTLHWLTSEFKAVYIWTLDVWSCWGRMKQKGHSLQVFLSPSLSSAGMLSRPLSRWGPLTALTDKYCSRPQLSPASEGRILRRKCGIKNHEKWGNTRMQGSEMVKTRIFLYHWWFRPESLQNIAPGLSSHSLWLTPGVSEHKLYRLEYTNTNLWNLILAHCLIYKKEWNPKGI